MKATRDQGRVDAERARAAIETAGQSLSPTQLTRFAAVARRRMRGKDGGFQRDHLRAFAKRVEVSEREVRIMGSKNTLLRVLAASNGVESATNGGEDGIRTHDTVLPYTPLAGERLRPLGHLSAAETRSFAPHCQPLCVLVHRCVRFKPPFRPDRAGGGQGQGVSLPPGPPPLQAPGQAADRRLRHGPDRRGPRYRARRHGLRAVRPQLSHRRRRHREGFRPRGC